MSLSGVSGLHHNKDVAQQLQGFLQGTSSGGSKGHVNLKLARIGLQLLKNLPGARDAVLEYYAGILDSIVAKHNPDTENQTSITEEEEEIVSDLQVLLSGFVEGNPQSWSPVISKWSLDTLGRVSSQHHHKFCGKSSSLHDKVSAWLSCTATSFLINITAECLSKLIDHDTESCISSLLDTSVRYAPHFDWAVAHIGSCFPKTVIKRVLSVGFKDFEAMAAVQLRDVGEINLSVMPKLISAVNILYHLAITHRVDLQQAVHSLLFGSLSSGLENDESVGGCPYILHLASCSRPVCTALTTDLSKKIDQSVLSQLETLFPVWIQRYFPDIEKPVDILVTLILSTDRGGPELVIFLLELGAQGNSKCAHAAKLILNNLIADIFKQVHSATRHQSSEIPLFMSMGDCLPNFFKFLLSDDEFLVSSTAQLLSLYALHSGRNVSIQLIKFFLGSSQSSRHLSTMAQILTQVEIFHYNCVHDAVYESLHSTEGSQLHIFKNLTKLVRLEKESKVEYKSSFVEAVQANHMHLVENILNKELLPYVVNLLRLLPPDISKLRMSSLQRLCHYLVDGYMRLLLTADDENSEHGTHSRTALLSSLETIFRQIGELSSGLQIMLRLFLDATMNSCYTAHLGGQMDQDEFSEVNSRQKQSAKIFKENLRFGSMPIQPLGSSTVFHAGVIGDGVRKAPIDRQLTEEDNSSVHRQALVNLISSICEASDKPGEGYKQLSLILVECISPDVMYNGIPWPGGDFIKVTVERDLEMTGTLEKHPILWDLLEILAINRPALSYCSVIVRAVMAVCIFHWQSNASCSLKDHPAQLEMTRRVLTLMDVGQFIPPQLAVLAKILQFLDPSQLQCVLIDIWNYMRVHVPGPNVYEVSEQQGLQLANKNFGPYDSYRAYCDRLRLVMTRNIDRVGPLFKVYFIDAISNNQNGHIENGVK